ncbi:hypothetical protein [Pseudomonas gingeri]|uniref:hypothetical protein n=1 Tax=Pseudomonas gingeri TaxID=117681 RepID=UPI0021097D2C|nr:hypothetical protein [Pseudomonas gingeri]
MKIETPTEQQAQLLKLPIVFSESAWFETIYIQGPLARVLMFIRRCDAIQAAYEAICQCTSDEIPAFYDFGVECDVLDGNRLELRLAVVRMQGQLQGLQIMLRHEVYVPEQRVPGLFFAPGHILTTRGVDALKEQGLLDISAYLRRHLIGDWGDLGDEDKQANEQALLHGTRLFSAYEVKAGEENRLQIITEADRSFTTLILSSED